MKLSHQHEAGGLAGYLRSTVTGEMIHFSLPRGQHRVHVSAVLGDKHLDGYLTFESILTDDAHDDVDMQVLLQIPGNPTGKDLDYKPVKSPASSVDIDGMPMVAGPVSAEDDTLGDIKEEAPNDVRESILTPEERAKEETAEVSRKETSDAAAMDRGSDSSAPRETRLSMTPELIETIDHAPVVVTSAPASNVKPEADRPLESVASEGKRSKKR